MAASTSASPQPRLYAILYPLTHPGFRLPVLTSVANQYRIPLRFFPLPKDDDGPWSYQSILDSYDESYDPEADNQRAFNIVSLPSDEDAALLLRRCTVIRRIIHLWAAGSGPLESTLNAMKDPSSDALYTPFKPAEFSWKTEIITLGVKLPQEEKRDIIEQTGFMAFQGPVNLRDPHFEWAWYEERWGISAGFLGEGHNTPKAHSRRLTVVGRRIMLPGEQTKRKGSAEPVAARDWIDRLDLKKRSYIGNTSMESEMSLNMAQMAQSGPGALVYDPFVGTGSLVVAAAALGAYVMGSDIDGRMMRGKAAQKDSRAQTGIMRSAQQYGIQGRFLDFCTFDITQHPWRMLHRQADSAQNGIDTESPPPSPSRRSEGFLDAIIADPPYGVRAGAKRLGNRDVRKQRDEPYWLEDKQAWSHEQDDYIPPTRPYALVDLLNDLLTFAAQMLRDDGRLVFWMPVMHEEEGDNGHGDGSNEAEAVVPPPPPSVVAEAEAATAEATPIPSGPEWQQIAVSTQDFGKWARRLVTLQRIPRDQCRRRAVEERARFSDSNTQFHAQSGRFRANVDAKDFRNQVSNGEEQE